MKELQGETGEFDKLKTELEKLNAAKEVAETSSHLPPRPASWDSAIEEFERKLKEKEFQIFLSGKYDRNNAVLSIYAGAGGQDAQDWATLLLRMYERYCQRKGYKTQVLHQSFGEAGGPEGRIGTKSVTLEIKGIFAYSFFKKESGVHRLVRISPFSPKALRHTSFALVEVIPEIEIGKEVEIKPEDLKTEFYRASGPGGQYVNKRETSVRITHLPTGIVVACQSERLQGDNRRKAMRLLLAKLYSLREEEKHKELSKIKGQKVSASWGNQKRNYVLHPYKMVKDLKSGIETSDVEGVLDGNLDKFIEEQVFIEQRQS